MTSQAAGPINLAANGAQLANNATVGLTGPALSGATHNEQINGVPDTSSNHTGKSLLCLLFKSVDLLQKKIFLTIFWNRHVLRVHIDEIGRCLRVVKDLTRARNNSGKTSY